ncbi:MAG: hypothetical protein AB1689_03655, partial [Thermodesulfobacteriota bacterium]
MRDARSASLLSLLCAVVALPAAVAAQPSPARVVVDADRTTGATNGDLLGVGWNSGDLSRLAPLGPPLVRIDSRLESAAPAPGVFELGAVLERAARVRAAGAEPLVILYGMPRWLGEERAAQCEPNPVFFPDGCSPILVAPRDLDAWEEVIRTVVRALATAPAPAHRFEAWNEPDLPVFWHDTRDAFFTTVAATHRAVRDVAEETGLPLRIGGPASSGSEFVVAYAAEILQRGLPLHFLSWHWYANNPFLGPDGAEGLIDPVLYEALAGVNPNATPAVYGEQARRVRSEVELLLREAGVELDPDLLIDEWNLSAGGLDRRHDSHEGAAFVAGTLIEMERAGLDGAAYYRSIGDREAGDWGLIAPDGTRKPTWWVFRAFERASGSLLDVRGDDPGSGFWARASRRGRRVDVLLASFRAVGGSDRRVTLEVEGDCAAESALVGRIDATSADWGRRQVVRAADGAFSLDLAAQSVAWLQLACPRGAAVRSSRCLPG